MSEIYEIRERGQVVTEGCQWIITHRRLAMQLAVKPVLILAIIELANISMNCSLQIQTTLL